MVEWGQEAAARAPLAYSTRNGVRAPALGGVCWRGERVLLPVPFQERVWQQDVAV